MGASPDHICHAHLHSGSWWLELAIGDGSAGLHTGCALGRWHPWPSTSTDRADAIGTMRRFVDLLVAAIADEADDDTDELDTLMSTWTTAPTSGPWPGVTPATWWSARTASQRAGMRDAIVAAGLTMRVSA